MTARSRRVRISNEVCAARAEELLDSWLIPLSQAWAVAGGTPDIGLALVDEHLTAPDGTRGKLVLMAEDRRSLAGKVERFEVRNGGTLPSPLAERLRRAPPAGRLWLFVAESRIGQGPTLALHTMDEPQAATLH